MSENGDEQAEDRPDEPADATADDAEAADDADDADDAADAEAADAADAADAAEAEADDAADDAAAAGRGADPPDSGAAGTGARPSGGAGAGGDGGGPRPVLTGGRWQRPLVALAAATVLLAAVSFVLNRRTDDPRQHAVTATVTRLGVVLARPGPGRYGCISVVPAPQSGPPRAQVVPRAGCDRLGPQPADAPREPVGTDARTAALRTAATVNAVLDRLARDCRSHARVDPGCPTIVIMTASGPVPAAPPVPHQPLAANPAEAHLARTTLAGEGFPTAVVRVAMPYDPAPAGSLLWAIDTGGACAIGYRPGLDPLVGGTALVLGKLDSGACLR
jgi:hypothetical protein